MLHTVENIFAAGIFCAAAHNLFSKHAVGEPALDLPRILSHPLSVLLQPSYTPTTAATAAQRQQQQHVGTPLPNISIISPSFFRMKRVLALRGGAVLPGSELPATATAAPDQRGSRPHFPAATRTAAAEASDSPPVEEESDVDGEETEGEESESRAGAGLSERSLVPGVQQKVGEVRGGMVAGLITKVFHIERHELPKFLTMSFMMFAIIYVFTMTRYDTIHSVS